MLDIRGEEMSSSARSLVPDTQGMPRRDALERKETEEVSMLVAPLVVGGVGRRGAHSGWRKTVGLASRVR